MTETPVDLAGKRVLFVSVSYSPEHAGIGPYAAASAERLRRDGARVEVVAGLPHYPSWRLSPDDRWRLSRVEWVNGIPVTRLRQYIPRRQTALTRGFYELTFLVHGMLRGTRRRAVDVVVAVVPSLAGGVLAQRVAAHHGVPLVLIVQDLSGAGARQSGILGGRLAAGLVSALERRLFKTAAALGLVHSSLAEHCRAIGVSEDRIHVVPNWTLQQPPVQVEKIVDDSWRDRFVVLHAGNMGLKQGLEVVVDAARLAQHHGHTDLLFVLMGDGSRRGALMERAEDISTLSFVDPVAGADFPGVLAAADLGLVAQRSEVHDMSVPSKLTAYFNAGVPVLASVAAECGTAREVRSSGAGVVIDAQEPEALLSAVLALRDSPAQRGTLAAAGRTYASDFLSAEAGLDRVTALVVAGLNAAT